MALATMQRKRGRPREPDPLRNTVGVRLTDDVMRALDAFAGAMGRARTSTGRDLIEYALDRLGLLDVDPGYTASDIEEAARRVRAARGARRPSR